MGRLERMKRGSGIEDRDEKSSGINPHGRCFRQNQPVNLKINNTSSVKEVKLIRHLRSRSSSL
jgi:hypothetical protein